jgi:crotonobetainyl-CoA:carnitine CoA-transferase CaiB-like acyl-CoA transferase
MQAMGERDLREPVQAVGGIMDQMGATILATGILAALLSRERTGRGQKVNTSLLGSALHLQAIGVTVASLRGKGWTQHARTRTKNPLTNHYKCGDGKWILFSEIQADRFWPEFCRALSLDALIDDPKFATAMGAGGEGGRRDHADELIGILDRTLATRPRDEWIAHFDSLRSPFSYAPVNDYSDVVNDAQVLANDYVIDFDHPAAGPVRLAGYPVRFSDTPAHIAREAPEFGQHTEEVLRELAGLSWEEIASLRAEGVV